jgi:hypothetical protein
LSPLQGALLAVYKFQISDLIKSEFVQSREPNPSRERRKGKGQRKKKGRGRRRKKKKKKV